MAIEYLDDMASEDKQAIVLILVVVIVLATWPSTAEWAMPVERVARENIFILFATAGLLIWWAWRKRTAYRREGHSGMD